MWQVQLHMPRLPIGITCRADGCVSFAPIAQFDVFIDQLESGEQIILNESNIKLDAENVLDYNTHYRYKDMPVLLKWLRSLDMDMPHFQ